MTPHASLLREFFHTMICPTPRAFAHSLRSLTYLTLQWPAKGTFNIDIGEIVKGIAPTVAPGGVFTFPNMFKSGKARRLADASLAAGPPVRVGLGGRSGRKLGIQPDKKWALPVGNSIVQKDSFCMLSYTGMPKSLQCVLSVALGDAPQLKLKTGVELTIGYDLDGTSLVVGASTGFSTTLGSASDYSAVPAEAQVRKRGCVCGRGWHVGPRLNNVAGSGS